MTGYNAQLATGRPRYGNAGGRSTSTVLLATLALAMLVGCSCAFGAAAILGGQKALAVLLPTRTMTPTLTHTPTVTSSPTRTSTATATASRTPMPTSTLTATASRTPTRTLTATPRVVERSVTPTPGPSITGQPTVQLTLGQAVAQGLAQVEVNGSNGSQGRGASMGDSVYIRVTRLQARVLELSLAPGTVLVSQDAATQSMVVARVRGIPIGDNKILPLSTILVASDQPTVH